MAAMAALIVVSVGLLRTALMAADAAQIGVRTLSWDPDQRIVDRLMSEDRSVVISRRLEPEPIGSPQDWHEVLREVVSRSDIVVMIEERAVDCVLSEGGSWIDTRIRGTVGKVLRQAQARKVATGSDLEVHMSGGELMVGKVRVVARDPSAAVEINQVPTGGVLLLFLRDYSNTWYPMHPPLIVNSVTKYPWRYEVANQPINPLENMSIEDIGNEIARIK